MTDVVRAGAFEIPVLYEDNHILAVVKPPNMPAQADSSGDEDLLCILKGYIGYKYHKPGEVYLGLVHRLDRPVGGAMVFARTSKAAARLSEAFARHAQDRRYLAVLQGELGSPRTLEDFLLKGEDGMVRVVDRDAPGAKLARLSTSPLAVRSGRTLAEVELFTGRSHQIRVQHKNAGLPLWGDARYGGGKPGQQIALWAHRLGFMHPTLREPVRLKSLPPNDGAWAEFYDVIEGLG
ncbi:MAG: RNA pseudouridine synthase [Clostridiales bacterium]|jgi:23S rRNA pseudouridine1911/1915/1917 synthase|nr:RNA pseudouridine synthase [Clostridiales bacterium]